MKRTIFSIFFMALIIGPYAYADEQKELSEIVVTATKTKQKAQEAPTKVEVVKAAQIADANLTTPDQALNSMPGVFNEREKGPIGLTEPRSGLTLRGLPGQERTLVLVDGQKLNNYEGAVFWWSIPTESIERIEVAKGPMSSLYGGSAMGGVVNIITKTEYVPLHFSLGLGSYDLKEISAGSGGRSGDFAYHVMYNRKTVGEIPQLHQVRRGPAPAGSERIATATGGTTIIDGYNTWLTTIEALELGCDWDVSADSTLGLKAGNATFDWEPQENINTAGADITSTLRKHATRHINLTYESIINEYADLNLSVGVVDLYEDLFQQSPSRGESNRPSSTYTMGLQSNIKLPLRNTLTFGLDSSRTRVTSEDYFYSDEPQFTKGKVLTGGVFLQDEFRAFDFLIFYAGARYDYWKAFDAKNNAPGGEDVSDEKRGHLSPKGSIVVLPDDKTTIRATVGESFRAPAAQEMFTSSYTTSGTHTLPNLELKPETVLGYEGNVERIFFDRLTLGATYFSNHIKDYIDMVDLNDDERQNLNIAEAYSKGYELSVRFKVTDDIMLFANQTHTKTKITKDDRTFDIDETSLEGKQFTGVPKDVFNYGASAKIDRFFGELSIKTVSDQYYESDNSDIFDGYLGYERYTTADVTLGCKFYKNCSLSLTVNNVQDNKYWEGADRNPGRTYIAKSTLTF